MIFYNKLGSFLYKRRRAFGYTQEDVAEIIGISSRTLRNIEYNYTTPEFETIMKLCEQYLDKNGRTILWRRFNKNDWAFKRYGKLWTEMLPYNETLTVKGETYVHWYDCITDYIL